MQGKYCNKHQRNASIVDLELSQLLCERCALFDPLYTSHKFIDLESLPQHATGLFRQFQKDLSSLNISVDKDAISNWRIIEDVAIEIFKEKSRELNTTYDDMIAQIQRERKEMLLGLEDQIKRIVLESNESVNGLVREKYHKLYCKNKYLEDCLKGQKYLLMEAELIDKSAKRIIEEIEKELTIVEIDLRQKLKNLNCSQLPIPDMIPRRATFGRDELLIPIEFDDKDQKEEKHNEIDKHNEIEIDIGYKTQRIHSHCKTESTYLPSSTERIETVQSAILFQSLEINEHLDTQITSSSIALNPKNTKNITSKAELKTLFLKNNVKNVNLTNLALSNREALEAIRKCSLGTSVSRIDISGNEISTQLIVLLKKQKIQSKNLKSIIMKGIKLDEKILKKEGLNLEKLAEGKLHLAELTIQIN